MTDTIFAMATPAGHSAIAVCRLSGPASYAVANRLSGKELQHRLVQPSVVHDEEGRPLDEVMLLYLKAPASPTGEDMLEIHMHGSLAVTQAIISYLGRQPECRHAEAGEFTKRAFANGKMDLTEIEALADLIESQTETQRQLALTQLKGALRKTATAWRNDIIQLSARLESLIDFADEDLPGHVIDDLTQTRHTLIAALKQAVADSARGEILRSGLKVALIGPVNAGKSTALNALAGRPAAIVSDEAGTTRDIVEVRLDLQGLPVILQDTAGIRDRAGHVEAMGIERAKQAATDADMLIFILDGTARDWQEAEKQVRAEIGAPATTPHLLFLNKKDHADFNQQNRDDVMAVSWHEASDVATLEALLTDQGAFYNHGGKNPLIARERHLSLIQKALSSLESSASLSLEIAPELVAEELRQAADALGRMMGHIDVEDILDDIFSSFCIGK